MSFSTKTTGEEVAALFKEHIKGKVVLVTGVSTKSIGAETVRVLAPYARTIIAASRSIQRTEEALIPIRKESPNADIRVVSLDLADESSIRAAAKEVLALNLPINVLIANAAVPHYKTIERTKQGFEAQFGANHLGHFLFTSLIFPAIRTAATPSFPSRVVVVSSNIVVFDGAIRWDDTDYKKSPADYSKYRAYADSKLANVLFAREITRRYQSENVVGFSLHPGAIWTTNMGSAAPKEELIALGVMNPDGTPAEGITAKDIPQGASTTIAAAFDPSILGDAGAYLDDCVPHDDRLPEKAKSHTDASKLWELSEQIWGKKFTA